MSVTRSAALKVSAGHSSVKPATVNVNCEGFSPSRYGFGCKSDFTMYSVAISYIFLSLFKDGPLLSALGLKNRV